MTENPEVPGEEARPGSTAPGLEGEGGQYVEGDYGDAGAARSHGQDLERGEYPDGDYGDAGAARAHGQDLEQGGYARGDYGEAGAVGTEREEVEDGEYPDGDYGGAGATGTERATGGIREGLTDRQVNTTAEERGPLHGDRDSDR
jgi:hypothetical protein